MGNKMYVGNLSYDVQNADLAELFGEHGTVQSAEVIMDRDSGQSKGFGFVEMSTNDEASAAIAALNGFQLIDTTVPEPSSSLLLSGLGLAALMRRRR